MNPSLLAEAHAKMSPEQRQEIKDLLTVHHPSNAKNCPKCMDLWIERENKRALSKSI